MLLSEDVKKRMLEEWEEKIWEHYPIRPRVKEIDYYIRNCTSKILSRIVEVYNGGELGDIDETVDDLMRFLATDRKLSPGDSIGLILYLKNLFLKEFPDLSKDEYIKLNQIIDRIACIAFDKYMACREHIYRLRVMEKEREVEMIRRMIEFYEKATKRPDFEKILKKD